MLSPCALQLAQIYHSYSNPRSAQEPDLLPYHFLRHTLQNCTPLLHTVQTYLKRGGYGVTCQVKCSVPNGKWCDGVIFDVFFWYFQCQRKIAQKQEFGTTFTFSHRFFFLWEFLKLVPNSYFCAFFLHCLFSPYSLIYYFIYLFICLLSF